MSEQFSAGDNELEIEEFEDDDSTDIESEDDTEGQALAENEQEQPRTITQKIGNAIEDLIPGDSDKDGH